MSKNSGTPDPPAGPGHNSGKPAVKNVVGIAAEQLQSIVARIERLEEEKKKVADDIKDVYAEARSNGFDTKILRQTIRRRRMDKAAKQEADALLELYEDALDFLN